MEGLKSTKDLEAVTGSLTFGPDNVVSVPMSFFKYVDGEWVRIEG